MVDPAHQRKGIGAKLLATVLEKSDAENVPTFLVASTDAHGLYKRLGFVELGEFKSDNEQWSREIINTEQRLGVSTDIDFEKACKGLNEVDRCMIRWARRE
jgi:GNAT superfamily N-acetyltransferase